MAPLGHLRKFLKRVLPVQARHRLNKLYIHRMDGAFKNLDRRELFDTVYRDRLWGDAERGLSGWGSYGGHSRAYIDFVKKFVQDHQVTSILDVGCGDFSIGSRLSEGVPKFIGADISSIIIDRNRCVFAELKNVEFRQLDVCVDLIPPAELITIREVLQHLTNSDISKALDNIQASGARLCLITEHLPAPDALRFPNADKPRGPNVRIPFGSGVYIDRPPFNRNTDVVLSVQHPIFAVAPSYLVTSLWRLKPS